MTRRQLLDLGMSPGAIRGRLERGQLHQLWSGVYAVGRPDVGRLGRFKGATLACGSAAQLSHRSAADLWRIRPQTGGPVDVAIPSSALRRRRGVLIHRRAQNALERRFLALVRDAGLPPPATRRRLGGNRVDFFWPELGFIVETDSLRHHRTAAEQATDIGRDQAHVRTGLRTLRFTHFQVFHRPDHVRAVLLDAFRHLGVTTTGRDEAIA